uniref:Expressed conserved protein n=1 Tax=Echinococcus granulosus TaxID=6210 RepID=A0A068WYH9_ECHGR|nr:expressed conserved protein [Echinococcus granulosus]
MSQDEKKLSVATVAGTSINFLKMDQSLNIYPKCCQNHTHSAIPQIYTSDDIIKCVTPNSQDKAFLFYYPNVDDVHANLPKSEDLTLKSERPGSPHFAPQPKCLPGEYNTDEVRKPPGKYFLFLLYFYKVTTRGQHPGFILLSVKHEKINDTLPSVRVVTGGHKTTSLPLRKISRKRFRKVTLTPRNSENIHLEDVGPLSTEDALIFDPSMKEKSSTHSRFRVTRIADSSSWWIPRSPTMNICVHDLKTSSIPDFVAKQCHKITSSLSSATPNYNECSRDFWNCLEPDYLQNVKKDATLST